MDVFLSLYVLGSGHGDNALLPFLLAAVDEEEAVDLSDAFIEEVERLGSSTSTARDRQDARQEIASMRTQICLLEEEDEIALVMQALKAHNPHFERDVRMHAGGLFTVGVNTEAGFESDAANTLRNRMSGHRLLASLSVEIEG